MERKRYADMNCSVAQCLEIVGEWWSMPIVRDVFGPGDRGELILTANRT